MVDFVVLAALVDSVASFLQTWSGRAVAVLVGLGILGIVFRNLISRVFDALMEELVQRTEGVPYLHAVLKRLHPQTATEILDHQEETKDHVEDIHEEVVTTSVELLEDQGLERLTEGNFDPGKRDPEACWRRPFEFAEIRAEFAIDRQRTDDERTNVTEDLLGKLQAEEGQSQIVVGPPGSGKTTVCKTVATEWYESEELGPVFYRESGATHSITDPGDVVEGLSELLDDGAGGRVLVVVEDAVRAGTIRIHKAIDDCPSDLDVSFLLDAREHKWDDFGETVRTHLEMGTSWNRILENRTRNIQRYQIPILDPDEVGRAVSKFAEVTDSSEEPLPHPETLHDQITGDVDLEDGGLAGPSPMLLLTYHFPVGGIDISGRDEDKSALRRHVEEVYSEVNSGADDSTAASGLLDDVALLVNVLNAADIGVHEELVQTVASDDEERAQVSVHLRDDLAGLLTYGGREGKQFWSNHELWSQVYLDHFLRVAGEDTARNWFGRVVSEFLAILDGEEENPELWRWYQGGTELLREIENIPSEKADNYVISVFGIGLQRPRLAPLFGRTNDHDPISVPVACSRMVQTDRVIARGIAYEDHGEYQKAREEYEAALELARELGFNEIRTEAMVLNHFGNVSAKQSDYEAAREYYERSLAIVEEIGDRAGEANPLLNLGEIDRRQGDYESAREYYERSLAIFEDLGHRAGEAWTLHNLGTAFGDQGNYESAREYYERSLDIKRDLGDRAGEALTLNNLGEMDQRQGDYESAREYLERALDTTRELGDRAKEARALHNLGNVALLQDDYKTAREYCHQSLALHRELGDRAGQAETLQVMGLVALHQSHYNVARRYFELSLAIARDIGERPTEAGALSNLGNVARDNGDYDLAKEYYESAAEIYNDIDAIRKLVKTHQNLAYLCERQRDLESAIEWCEIGLSTINRTDISGLEDEHKAFEALLDQLRASDEPIGDLYTDALESALTNEGWASRQYFRNAWEQRNEASEEEYPLAIAAGVGVAAHLELLEEEGSDEEKREILEKIRPDRHQLSRPVDTVFKYLAEGGVGVTPTELLNSTAPELAGAYKQSVEKLDRDDLEVLGFTRLLEVLTDSGPEFSEGNVVAGYRQALQRMLGNESGDFVRTLHSIWEQRDSIDEDAEEFSSVLSAGIAFAALLHFFNDKEADKDRKEILDEIKKYEDRLAQPELPVYEYLTEGGTETSPEELRNMASKDKGKPNLHDLECFAFARFLEEAQVYDRGAIAMVLGLLKSWLL